MKIKTILTPSIKYTLTLFLISRFILTLIGVVSRWLLDPLKLPIFRNVYSKYLWLDIWGQWDSGWYLNIARHWYPENYIINGQCSYGFFPLYPLLIRGLGVFLKDNFIAGLFISNVALILAGIFLYKLVELDWEDDVALRSVKYLFLFPTAFIFSGVFSEALFIFLLIFSFWSWRKQKWFLAGIIGFFLCLTRVQGVIAVLPFLILYLRQLDLYPKKKLRVLYLLFFPFGVFLFFAYTRMRMGDWFAYLTAQKFWGVYFNSPMSIITHALSCKYDIRYLLGFIFSLTLLFLSVIFFKKIGIVYGMLSVGFLISYFFTNNAFLSVARYSLVVFPIYIIFALISKNKYVDDILTITFSLLQGFFMVFWSRGFCLVV